MSILTLFRRDRIDPAVILHDAMELRRRYGDKAELWCEAGMQGAPSNATRRMLKEIHKALADRPVRPLS